MISINKITELLKNNNEVKAYEIIQSDNDSRELFFVLSNLEINRAVKVTTIVVNVFVDKGRKRGSSTFTVFSNDDETSVTNKINSAVDKAKAAYNPYYPLAKANKMINRKLDIDIDLNETALKVAEAIFKADKFKDGWINSTEIFLTLKTTNFYNSNDIHHCSQKFSLAFELIPTWSKNKIEFETYKYYESGTINYKAITKEVADTLSLAKARANARQLKDVDIPKDIPVLVKGEMLELLCENLAADLSYLYNYRKMNHYNKGDRISDTAMNLTMMAKVDGCLNSEYFDGNGKVLKNKRIIENGLFTNSWGSVRFGYYLKEKNISGTLPIMSVNGPTYDYKKTKHLIIENFSSPQLEEASGYFGGEVRLARYFDGKKYIPLTNFSVSGNFYEDVKTIAFSKEKVKTPAYAGPKYWIFKNMNIN